MYPLFEAGRVDVIEHTWEEEDAASWTVPLLDHYGASDRLVAHLVRYPVCCEARDLERHVRTARAAAARRTYRHVSAHFGVVEARTFDEIAPIPVVPARSTITRGAESLLRLRDAVRVPVGLENLAIAFSNEDVRAQGDMIDAMLAPSDGFLLLDVHNLYCQSHNFEITPEELLASYPTHRAREIHVSGGRWDRPKSDARGRMFRRDTHDDAVPEEVFAFLELALTCSTNVDTVILERIHGTLAPKARDQFKRDFQRVTTIVRAHESTRVELAGAHVPRLAVLDVDAESIARFERDLMQALTSGATPDAAIASLLVTTGDPALRAHIAFFELRAIEIAASIQARWATR